MKLNSGIKLILVLSLIGLMMSCAKDKTDSTAIPQKVEKKMEYKHIDMAWVNTLPKPWTLTEAQFDTLLPQFHQHYPDFHDRLYAFAKWRIGTPYEIFKLGEESGVDTDPIIRYDVSDCTGHVLTSLAAVESISWKEARNRMIDLHYKLDETGEPAPDYKHRWHFTADRLLNNPRTRDISQELVDPTLLDTVHITLNQKEDGTEFLDLDWTSEVDVMYIPNDQITEKLLQRLPQIVGVSFVKKAYFKMGIVMAHEGMILDGQYLLHASQAAGETVLLNFLDYYFPLDGKPKFDGIMISEFVPAGE